MHPLTFAAIYTAVCSHEPSHCITHNAPLPPLTQTGGSRADTLRLAAAIHARLKAIARSAARGAAPANAPPTVHARLWQIWGAAAAAKGKESRRADGRVAEQIALALAPLLARLPPAEAAALRSGLPRALDAQLSIDRPPKLVVAPAAARLIDAADGASSNGEAGEKLRAAMEAALVELFLEDVVSADVESGSGMVHELVKGRADEADGSSGSSSGSSSGGSGKKGLVLRSGGAEVVERGHAKTAELRRR